MLLPLLLVLAAACSSGAVGQGGEVFGVQEAWIKAPNAHAGANFGYSVATDGDTVAVGAYRDASCGLGMNDWVRLQDLRCPDRGAVFIYVRDAVMGTWSLDSVLQSEAPFTVIEFGFSLALQNGTLVVGAPRDANCERTLPGNFSTACLYSGAVYIYQRQGPGAWSFDGYLKASTIRGGASFASSVALDGDTLVVGTFWEASCSSVPVNGNETFFGNCSEAGAAYVFARNTSGAWNQEAYLKSHNTTASERFGFSVALQGDVLAVGSPFEKACGFGFDPPVQRDCGLRGAVYLFERTAGTSTWNFVHYLKPPSVTGEFGRYLSFQGSTLLVGTFLFADDLFEYTQVPPGPGGNWSYRASYPGLGGVPALDGDVLYAGRPADFGAAAGVQTPPFSDGGRVVPASGAFTRLTRTGFGQNWTATHFAKASFPQPEDGFGFQLAARNGVAVSGSFLEDSCGRGINNLTEQFDNGCESSGAVWVFFFGPRTTTGTTGVPVTSGGGTTGTGALPPSSPSPSSAAPTEGDDGGDASSSPSVLGLAIAIGGGVLLFLAIVVCCALFVLGIGPFGSGGDSSTADLPGDEEEAEGSSAVAGSLTRTESVRRDVGSGVAQVDDANYGNIDTGLSTAQEEDVGGDDVSRTDVGTGVAVTNEPYANLDGSSLNLAPESVTKGHGPASDSGASSSDSSSSGSGSFSSAPAGTDDDDSGSSSSSEIQYSSYSTTVSSSS